MLTHLYTANDLDADTLVMALTNLGRKAHPSYGFGINPAVVVVKGAVDTSLFADGLITAAHEIAEEAPVSDGQPILLGAASEPTTTTTTMPERSSVKPVSDAAGTDSSVL